MDSCSKNKNKTNKNAMYISRIPWSDFQEWKNCYDNLFSNAYGISGKKIEKINDTIDFFIDSLDYSNLQKAFNILNIWNSRTDSNTYILATLLLLEEIIKFLNNSYLYFNINDKKHILSQKIIRVTNLIIDDLKKKNRKIASNMFLVAKEINLPEFIIEIRHICTHKNLPDLNTLIFTIKYLYFWLKSNIWDKQFEIFMKETKSKEKLFEILNEIDKYDNASNKNPNHLFNKIKEKLESIDNVVKDKTIKFKFEINNIIDIINSLLEKFCKCCAFSSQGKVLNEKIKEFGALLDYLFKIEDELLIILIYKYISEFAFFEVVMKIFEELKKEEYNLKISISKTIDKTRHILKKFTFLIFYIQKFIHKKNQLQNGSSNIYAFEKTEDEEIKNKNKSKDKQNAKIILENKEVKKQQFPFLLNYIYDLLKFSQDFSVEIREIFDMFTCNFKDFCESVSKSQTLNSLFNENTLQTMPNSFLRKKKQRENEGNSINENLSLCPPGSLIFRQLEKISSEDLKKRNDDIIKEECEKNETDENYNFSYMDKRLKKMIEKENKKKILNKIEEGFDYDSNIYLNENCFFINLNEN